MTQLTRRSVLAAAAGGIALPRVAIAQADTRPVLTIAVQKISNSNTLEPPREQSNVGYRLSPLFSETLIDFNWTGDLARVPGLATAWQRIDDRTVEFTLRPGVRFHNGDTLTAEDVAFSLGPDRLFGTEAAAGTSSGLLAGSAGKAPPKEVVATGKRTFPGFERIEIVRAGVVRFVNRVPDVTLEGRIAQNIGAIFSRRGFAEAESWLAWARRPIGTGPYRIADYRPDVSLTFEAHDDYWGGRPPARQVRVVEVPEVASRINGLFSGEYDFICDMPPDQIAMIERNARFEVLGSPINNIRLITFDASHPVLRDARIRRALSLSVDRRMIVDTLWSGRTDVPRGLQMEFYGDMYLADRARPGFDPAEARRLVAASGYKGEPITYRLLNNYYTNQTANAQVLVEMWRAVGLNVRIEMKENWQQINDPSSQRGIRDWSNTSLFGDPVAGLVRGMGPRGELQLQKEWTNEAFNRLVAVLETSNDRGQRRQAFARMLDIAENEDPAYLVLHQAATFTAKRKDIAWKASKAWALDLRASNLRFGG
jgi:peptide/nickel transport system substrate-binding protein